MELNELTIYELADLTIEQLAALKLEPTRIIKISCVNSLHCKTYCVKSKYIKKAWVPAITVCLEYLNKRIKI